MDILQDINLYVQQGRAKMVCDLVEKALNDGMDAAVILKEGLLPAMDDIGVRFRDNVIFVPDVLVAARALSMGMDVLRAQLGTAGIEPVGVAVIGTVRGDMHDIGKNIVKMMLEGKGIEVHDLGVNVNPERFYSAAEEFDADIVCCSVLLTTMITECENIVKLFTENQARGRYYIMIGGAAVNQSFADAIGADCYTEDAASAAMAAYAFCKSKREGRSRP